MLILLAGSKSGSAKSICAVNLACQLANLDSLATDRWQGEYSVVLVDADAEATATRCCSGGNLPVSSERLSPEDAKDVKQWIRKMRALMAQVDYVVVDGPADIDATKGIVGISDLVVIPCSCSSSDLEAVGPMVELATETHTIGSERPNILLVPSRVEANTATCAEIETALHTFGQPVGPVIHEWKELAEAFNTGRWIGDFAPKSAACAEIKVFATSVQRSLRCARKGFA